MRKRTAITIGLLWLLLLLVFATPASSQPSFLFSHAEATENSWTTKTSMPTAREGLGVAVVNGKIYAIGGVGPINYLNTNEMYDPATDTWTTKTPMVTPRKGFGITVYQNKIYVIGGATGQSTYTGVNEVYDPLTETWETKTSMPTPRDGLDANVVNGKIYLMGGYRYVHQGGGVSLQTFNLNEVYDPSTDTWTTKAPLPTAVEGYASAVVNNKIYVIGGSSGNLTQIYNPETNTWSFGKNIPTGVTVADAGATAGVLAPKRIYVIGGGSIVSINLNQIYDPERNVWSTGAQMPTSRSGLGVAVVDDILYAIGGSLGWAWGPIGAVEQYTPFGYGTVPLPDTTPPFPTTWIAAATAVIAIGVAALLVYFRKIKKTTGKVE